MADKTTLTQAQIVALLQSDDEYWTQIESIRTRWELPAGGFPTWTLETYYDESAATPLAQWEAEWQGRQVEQPILAVEADIARVNRRRGFPPILDQWLRNHLLHGDRCEMPYTRVTVARDDPEGARGLVNGVGVFIDQGKLTQIDWTAAAPLADELTWVWQGARLTAFSLDVDDRFEPPMADIAPNPEGCGLFLCSLRGSQTFMHDGIIHFLRYQIGFPSWRCALETFSLADLCFVLHPAGANSSRPHPGRPLLSEEERQQRREQVNQVIKLHDEYTITYEQACARIGVAYSSFRRWRQELTNN